jgi:hypothetical protein
MRPALALAATRRTAIAQQRWSGAEPWVTEPHDSSPQRGER